MTWDQIEKGSSSEDAGLVAVAAATTQTSCWTAVWGSHWVGPPFGTAVETVLAPGASCSAEETA